MKAVSNQDQNRVIGYMKLGSVLLFILASTTSYAKFDWKSDSYSSRKGSQKAQGSSWEQQLVDKIAEKHLSDKIPIQFPNCQGKKPEEMKFVWAQYFKGLANIESDTNPGDKARDSAGGDGLWQFSKGDVGHDGKKCLGGKGGSDVNASINCVVSMQLRELSRSPGGRSLTGVPDGKDNYGPLRRLTRYENTCDPKHLNGYKGNKDATRMANLIKHINEKVCTGGGGIGDLLHGLDDKEVIAAAESRKASKNIPCKGDREAYKPQQKPEQASSKSDDGFKQDTTPAQKPARKYASTARVKPVTRKKTVRYASRSRSRGTSSGYQQTVGSIIQNSLAGDY